MARKFTKLSFFEKDGNFGECVDYPDSLPETLLALSGVLGVAGLESNNTETEQKLIDDALQAVREANHKTREISRNLGLDQDGYELICEAFTLCWNAGVTSQRLFLDKRTSVKYAYERYKNLETARKKNRRNVTKEQIETEVDSIRAGSPKLRKSHARKTAAKSLGISMSTLMRRIKKN